MYGGIHTKPSTSLLTDVQLPTQVYMIKQQRKKIYHELFNLSDYETSAFYRPKLSLEESARSIASSVTSFYQSFVWSKSDHSLYHINHPLHINHQLLVQTSITMMEWLRQQSRNLHLKNKAAWHGSFQRKAFGSTLHQRITPRHISTALFMKDRACLTIRISIPLQPL